MQGPIDASPTAAVGLAIARANARPYWSVLLADGRIVSEWESVEWPDVPRGKRAIRLYAPDGHYAELGVDQSNLATRDRTLDGFVFQLKHATSGLDGEHVDAYLIGCIDREDGGCLVYSYEPDLGRIRAFRDNAKAMRYRAIGPISALHLGLRPELAGA